MTLPDIQKYVDTLAAIAPSLVNRHLALIQNYFKLNIQLEPSSLQRYAWVLRSFFAYLEKLTIDFSKIDIIVLNEFYVHRLDSCKRKVVNNQLVIVYSFLEYLNAQGLISETVYRKLKFQRSRFPKSRGSPPKAVLQESEINLLLASIKDERNRMIIWVLWHYALRPKELSKLKTEDVDLNDCYLIIRESKHHRTRFIPIPDSHVAEWRRWDAKKNTLFPGSPYIIPNKTSHQDPLSVDQMQKLVNKVGLAVLNKRVYPYLFRRTAATLADERGVPLTTISRILGHASISTTSIYIQKPMKKVKNDWIAYKEAEE